MQSLESKEAQARARVKGRMDQGQTEPGAQVLLKTEAHGGGTRGVLNTARGGQLPDSHWRQKEAGCEQRWVDQVWPEANATIPSG